MVNVFLFNHSSEFIMSGNDWRKVTYRRKLGARWDAVGSNGAKDQDGGLSSFFLQSLMINGQQRISTKCSRRWVRSTRSLSRVRGIREEGGMDL